MATYERPASALRALRLALAQTPPPSEVVIVDASADRRPMADGVGAIARDRGRLGLPPIEIRLHDAVAPSLPQQRSQGVAASAADIVVMFDDDALMHPGCAAAIVEVFAADVAGAVVGIEAASVSVPPDVDGGAAPADVDAKAESEAVDHARTPVKRWVLDRVLRADPTTQFIPYAGHYPAQPIPDAVARLGCARRHLLEGYRMAYRRSVFDLEQPEHLLMGAAYMEDYDFSYRASRHGALVAVPTARVTHLGSPGGRRDHADIVRRSLCNQALTLRRHSTRRRRHIVTFAVRSAWRGATGVVRDGWAGRGRLETMRATAAGLPPALAILAAGDATFEDRYRRAMARADQARAA